MSIPHGDLVHTTTNPEANIITIEHAHNIQKGTALPVKITNYHNLQFIQISRDGISYAYAESESHAEFPTSSQIWKASEHAHEAEHSQPQEKETASKIAKKKFAKLVGANFSRSTSAKSNAAHCSEILDEPEVVDLTEAVSKHDKEHSKLDILHGRKSVDCECLEEQASKTGISEKDKTGLRKYWRQLKESFHRIKTHNHNEHK